MDFGVIIIGMRRLLMEERSTFVGAVRMEGDILKKFSNDAPVKSSGGTYG